MYSCCYKSSNQGRCGLECPCHEDQKCDIIEEIVDDLIEDVIIILENYLTPSDINHLSHLRDVDYKKELMYYMGYDIAYESKLETGVTTMNINTIASLLVEGIKTVKVKFPHDDQEYTYKTVLTLEVGDYVAVNVASNNRILPQVTEVHEEPELDPDSEIEYKWILCSVDLTKVNDLIAIELSIVEKLNATKRKRAREQALNLITEEYGIKSLKDLTK